ncbi:MAG: hypothetical protein WCF24_10085 [Acidimicrobiales bacterium]
MEKHDFLSPEWVEAARAIYSRFQSAAEPPTMPLKMNLVVDAVPFVEHRFEAHLDTSAGVAEVEIGHVEDPDLTVTLPYDLAKSVFVDGNAQAGVEAFMMGLVRVDGDVTKLLTFQQQPPSPAQAKIASEIRAITA